MYDSEKDTQAHIDRVRELCLVFLGEVIRRALGHDLSKLESPEKEIFDVYTPKLRESTYGSDEYKEFLKEMKIALEHHYQANRHHPEHFENGVNDMNLIDLIELMVDQKAASERHADGDIRKSIEINKERFGLSDQLVKILLNTVDSLWGQAE